MNKNVIEIYYTLEDLGNSGSFIRHLSTNQEPTPDAANAEIRNTLIQMMDQIEDLLPVVRKAIDELGEELGEEEL